MNIKDAENEKQMATGQFMDYHSTATVVQEKQGDFIKFVEINESAINKIVKNAQLF